MDKASTSIISNPALCGSDQSRQGEPSSAGQARADKELRKPFSLLMELAAPHKNLYVFSVVQAVFGVACGFIPYFAVANMAVGLIHGGQELSYYLLWCAVAAVSFVAKSLLMGLSTSISHKATFAVLSEIRRALAYKLTRTPMGYVLNTPSGKMKTTIVERVEQLEVPLAHLVPEMTANVLVPLGIIGYLFVLDWRMALLSLITIPVGMLCYAIEMREYPKKYGEVMAAKNHMSATVVEYINGIKVIKAFNQSASSYAKFIDAVKLNSGLMLDWMRVSLPWTSIMLAVWPAVLVAVLPAGCFFYMDGSLSAPTFVTIIILSLGIVGPLFAVIMYTDDLAKVSTTVSQIGEVLDEPEMVRPTKSVVFDSLDITLENVGFSYGEEEVLQGVDLCFKQGDMVALVGPSGSGKSTIAKLIASFWDSDSGVIKIGGVCVRDIPSDQIARLIAYVAQDNFLFDDSIRNNIRMGDMTASDEKVEAVAKASGCHDFIMALDEGYDTLTGKAGGQLSGGERQRIAIARAMMKDAPIIILDEATAYTDPENEAIIQDAVANLAKGKTLIVIAHRLSTIVNADTIAVVDGGKILGSGTHKELLAICPLYDRLWRAHIDARDEI